MISFYGRGGEGGGAGISIAEILSNPSFIRKIQQINKHIVVSETQPTTQKEGDYWFVVVSDDNNG